MNGLKTRVALCALMMAVTLRAAAQPTSGFEQARLGQIAAETPSYEVLLAQAEPVESEILLAVPPVGICAAVVSRVVERDVAGGWAKSRCGPAPPGIPSDAFGFALNWRDAVSVVNGLSYATFLVNGKTGGRIRWNDVLSPTAVAIINSGGGATAWPEVARDGGPSDHTDWQDLQDRGVLVVGVQWKDMGISYGNGGTSAGRFTRNSAAGQTLGDMAERTKLLFEWINQHLNPGSKPLAVLGSSGGADATLSLLVRQSGVPVAYFGLASYPGPFWDPLSDCNGPTPPGTFVDPATGALGERGGKYVAGVMVGSGAFVVDGVLANNACSSRTMTPALAAGSSSKDALQAIEDGGGPRYTGVVHFLVGTLPGDDSDIANGVVWSAGNLMNHLFLADATLLWFESATEGHGDALTDIGGPGFDQIHAELVKALLLEQEAGR